MTHAPDALTYASFNAQAAADASHLKALSVCHYVWGSLVALISLVFSLYIVLGILTLTGRFPGAGPTNPPPPAAMGWIFIVIGVMMLLAGEGVAALNFLTARGLARRKWRVLSFVTAGINCLSVPVGTVLGVFTFVVLLRPSVTTAYRTAEVHRMGTG